MKTKKKTVKPNHIQSRLNRKRSSPFFFTEKKMKDIVIPIVCSGEAFLPYDYGVEGNYEKYGQPTPPPYDLQQVKAPVYLFWGPNDLVTTPEVGLNLFSFLSKKNKIAAHRQSRKWKIISKPCCGRYCACLSYIRYDLHARKIWDSQCGETSSHVRFCAVSIRIKSKWKIDKNIRVNLVTVWRHYLNFRKK